MDNKVEIKKPELDLLAVAEYFNEHPIMFIGAGISVTILAICKVLDDKYSK